MSVSTNTPTLGASWICLGAGPLFIEVVSGSALFAFSDSQPGLNDLGFVLLASSNGDIKTLETTSQIWARAAGITAANIAYAPVTLDTTVETPVGTSGANALTIQGAAGGSPVPVKGSSVWKPSDTTLTRPANTTATIVNGAIGSSSVTIFKFSNFFEASAAQELLTGLRLVMNASAITVPSGVAVRAHLFNVDVSATATPSPADAVTYKELIANAGAKLGTVDFTAFQTGGAGSDTIESYGQPILSPLHLVAAGADTALYALLVNEAVYTPIASAVVGLYASRAGL